MMQIQTLFAFSFLCSILPRAAYRRIINGDAVVREAVGARRLALPDFDTLDTEITETSESNQYGEQEAANEVKLDKPGALSVRMWQWNSGKKDIEDETLQVFRRGQTDLIAVCLTEAKPKLAVHEILEKNGLSETWSLLAYGRHTGFAGGERNAQILSVFMRQPSQGQKHNVERDDVSWISGIGWTVAGVQQDELMAFASVPGKVSAQTKIHQTSDSGKGGVSALLSFAGNDELDATKIALVCAHLDSEDTDKRRADVAQLMDEVSRWEGADSRHDWGERVRTWPGFAEEATPARLQINAVLLFGDLNFRLRYLKDDGSNDPFPADLNDQSADELMTRLLATQEGRQAMFQDDPLNPNSASSELLVKEGIGSFGFQCNDPTRSLPSYKRSSPKDCVLLARRLRDCQNPSFSNASDSDPCGNEAKMSLVAACFKTKDGVWKLKKEKNQPVGLQKRFLQLGWLDRVCYRSVHSPRLKISELGRVNWDENPFSDHAPAELVLSISHAKSQCQVPSEHRSYALTPQQTPQSFPYSWLEESKQWILPGRGQAIAQCASGYRFSVVPEGAATASVDTYEIDCASGVLSTSDGDQAADLTCLRYCEQLPTPENARRVDEPAVPGPRGALYVQGASTRFACDAFYVLRGPAHHFCREDGTYGEDAFDLKCLHTCKDLSWVEAHFNNGHVSLHRAESNQRCEECHGDVIAEGDRVEFSCEEGRFFSLDGGESLTNDELTKTSLTCGNSGKYDNPIPQCLAKCGSPTLSSQLRAEVTMPNKTGAVPWTDPMPIVQGHVVKYSCTGGSKLAGLDAVRCGDDGQYHPLTPGATYEEPACVTKCAVPPAPPNSDISLVHASSATSDAQLVAAPAALPLPAQVETATKLQYSCKEGCVLVGSASLTCQVDARFDSVPPQCVCDVTFEIHDIDMTEITKGAVERKGGIDKVKFKFFKRSVAGNMDDFYEGYDKASKKKVSPDFFPTELPLQMSLHDRPDKYFFHIELCGANTNMFSRSSCISRAHSLEPLADTNLEDCPMCVGSLAQRLLAKPQETPQKIEIAMQGEVSGKAILTMSASMNT